MALRSNTETAWRDRASPRRTPTAPGESRCRYRAADRLAAPSGPAARAASRPASARGAAPAQVARPDGRRARRRSRHLGRHAFEDRERQHLAVARDAGRAGQGTQRADQPAVRRNRGTPRLLVREGRAPACASSGAAPRPATSTTCSATRWPATIGVEPYLITLARGRRALHAFPPCRRRVHLHAVGQGPLPACRPHAI